MSELIHEFANQDWTTDYRSVQTATIVSKYSDITIQNTQKLLGPVQEKQQSQKLACWQHTWYIPKTVKKNA